ncbi:MAG: hypothetical protein QY309_16995 [Cyclobacteriaceae bacterium]|nr:MAG: hypothetical protein QY309_16995 [Cyclobacteriaceae bacterium]
MKTTSIFFLFLLSAFLSFGQKQVTNEEGGYRITIPESWGVKKEATVTDVYSPDEGGQDVWQEYLGISTGAANGLTLDEAFNYYIKTDFPEYYPNFSVINSGKETVSGLPVRWALCSYRADGAANNESKSAVIYNLFYLFLKDDVLYFLNGIAVESEYPRFEDTFRQIARSFSVSK